MFLEILIALALDWKFQVAVVFLLMVVPTIFSLASLKQIRINRSPWRKTTSTKKSGGNE